MNPKTKQENKFPVLHNSFLCVIIKPPFISTGRLDGMPFEHAEEKTKTFKLRWAFEKKKGLKT